MPSLFSRIKAAINPFDKGAGFSNPNVNQKKQQNQNAQNQTLQVNNQPRVNVALLNQALQAQTQQPQRVNLQFARPQSFAPLDITTSINAPLRIGNKIITQGGGGAGVPGITPPSNAQIALQIGKGLAQQTARSYVNLGLSAVDPFKKGRQVYQPSGKTAWILGKEPITSYQERQTGLQKAIEGPRKKPSPKDKKAYIEYGLRQKLAGPLSIGATGFNAALDASVAGGLVKGAVKGGKAGVRATKTAIANEKATTPFGFKLAEQPKRGEAPTTPGTAPSAAVSAPSTTTPNINLSDQIAQQGKASMERYGAKTFENKVKNAVQTTKNTWNPQAIGIEIDRARAKAMGIKYTKLPATQKMEFAAMQAGQAPKIAEEAIAKSNIGRVIQKYGTKNKAEEDFMAYAYLKREAEQRFFKNRVDIFPQYSEAQLTNEINRLEQKYPGIKQDVLSLNKDINQVQDLASTGNNAVISRNEVLAARTTPTGKQYKYYLPLEPALPEEIAKAQIGGKNIGSIGQQRVIRSMKGSQYPPKLKFEALNNYVKDVYTYIYRGKTGRLFAENLQMGAVPAEGARFIQTGDEAARVKTIKSTISDLNQLTPSLKKQATNIRIAIVKNNKDINLLKSKLGKENLKNDLKIKYKQQLSELMASKKQLRLDFSARQAGKMSDVAFKNATDKIKVLIKNQIDTEGLDQGILASLNDLGRKDWEDIIKLISYNREKGLTMVTKKAIKTSKTAGEKARKAKLGVKVKPSSFDQNTKTFNHLMDRIASKSELHNELADQLTYLRMDMESVQSAKQGLKQEYLSVREDPFTGLQTILGRDVNGNPFRIEVEPKYAKFLKGLDEEKSIKALEAWNTAQKPVRIGLVGILNPPFQLMQGIWNAAMLPITSPNGLKVYGPRAIKAAFTALNKNSKYQTTLRSKGSVNYGSLYNQIKRDDFADSLAAQANLVSKAKWYAHPKRGFTRLEELGGKLDQMARTQAAKAAEINALKRGASTEEAMAEAVLAHRTSLPDFQNVAPFIRNLDKLGLMFIAPSQAGTRTLLRAFRDRPIQTGATFSAGVATMTAITAYSYSQAKDFYDDMNLAKKKYLLDNNLIIALPGHKKNPKTGEWSGIVKISLPPELRPINNAIRESITNNDAGIPAGKYALDFFDFITGQTRTISNPVLQLAQTIRTGTDAFTGRQIFDQTSTPEEKRKAILEQLQRSFGLPGALTLADKKTEKFVKSFVDRVYGAKGTTPGGRFFIDENKAIKDVGLNKNELNAYLGSIAPRTKDLAGNVIKDKTYWDGSSKAQTWLRYPKTLEVSRRIDAEKRKRGEPGDPMFDLPDNQLKTVINLMANPSPGNREDAAITKLNPWLQDFYTKRSEYFDKVMTKEQKDKSKTDPMGVEIPQSDKNLQTLIDQAGKLSGAEKYQFYSDHPEITDYFKQLDDYQRQKRSFMNLPQFDKYPEPAPEVKQLFDIYNALPKGEANGKSKIRSAWIKSNPGAWAKMTEQWRQQDLYNIAKEGSLAVYEGIDFTDKTLKKMGMLPGQQNVGLQFKKGTSNYQFRKIRLKKIKGIKIPKVNTQTLKLPKVKKPKRIKLA